MHLLEWLLSHAGLVGTAVRYVFRGLRYVGAAIKHQLRTSSEYAAKSAPTASVIRGSRTRLRWYQWLKARELEREGHGVIRNGYYEKWVNVTPPGVLMAMQMRSMFSQPNDHEDWY